MSCAVALGLLSVEYVKMTLAMGYGSGAVKVRSSKDASVKGRNL